MSENDKAATLRALQAAKQERWSYAEAQIANTKDPLAARIYYWMYYTDAKGPFAFNRIASFVDQVPDWPKQGTLALAAEKSIKDDTPAPAVIEWFRKHPPLTADGMKRYLAALKKQAQLKDMVAVLNDWWGDANLTGDQQGEILRNYGKLIVKDAHKRRFNTTLHKQQYSNARGIARILGKGYPELAEARIRLAAGDSGVDYYVSKVPPHLQNDPGFQLERLRWRRKKNMDFSAMEILHNAPSPNLIANPEAWWTERNILTRRLIERKQYESAYLLVSKHGLKEGEPFAQAEFLSGWLALRFMKKPWEAFQHFEKLYINSTMPITKGRAAYWAGLASEELKHPEIALKWYETGAKYSATFYGQMALARLGRQAEAVGGIPPLPPQTRAAFERDGKIQAARLLFKAGIHDDADAFLRAYADKATTTEQFYLAAELSDGWQRPNDSVAIAKKAQTKGFTMVEYAFPTMLARMKKVKAEWALVHAIIRQESAFDQKAMSPVGARGLMQLMPATAKETAKKAGISHQNDWLVTRPDHNIQLGSHYINQMLARFDNSYPLAIAAYNAGPGRVNQWLREIGDPRKGEVDMIDWIELIPVAETRNYVQRVLEGVYIYRNKFKDLQETPLPIHVSYDKRKPLKAAR
ncbi:MAG: lytic transglycosylase domain-containing protein [Micavibrio sp.]